jgi:hypothetical protein
MNAVTPDFTPEVLETACEWTAAEVADPARWTEHLSPAEVDELDAAVQHAFSVSDDFLAIGKAQFPLPTLGPRLKVIEQELIDGRGFVLLRGLPRERWSNDEMSMAYWGIGMHLGKPWPQNAKGHLLATSPTTARRRATPPRAATRSASWAWTSTATGRIWSG